MPTLRAATTTEWLRSTEGDSDRVRDRERESDRVRVTGSESEKMIGCEKEGAAQSQR